MLNSGVAIDCTIHYKAGSGISFCRFPHSKPELLQKWTQAVKRKNWKPNKLSYISSACFNLSCFEVRVGKIGCKLSNDAVPSIFPSFLKYYYNQKAKRKPPNTRELAPSPSKVAKTVVS